MKGQVILAFDGANNSGKSTFINMLEKNINIGKTFTLPSSYKLICKEWWFQKSRPEELIDELISMVIIRKKEIDNSRSKIIFLDKGKRTISARIYATFKLRGLNEAEIQIYVDDFEKRYDLIMREDIHIYMENAFAYEENNFFKQYNKLQRSILREKIYDLIYCMRNKDDYADDNFVNEVRLFIKKYFLNLYCSKYLNSKVTIIVPINFTNSEISVLIRYLNKENRFLMIDIEYFQYQVTSAYGIEKTDFLYNEVVVHEIIDFIEKSEGTIILRDVRKYQAEILQKIFGDRYVIIDRFGPNFINCKRMYDILNIMKDDIDRSFFCNSLNLKVPEALKIPDDYQKVLVNVLENIKRKAKANLALLSVVGSCAFETVIEGWSDIDIFIIIKENDEQFLDYVIKLSNKYSIHVGINCFNINQINNNELDIKGKWYLYYMQTGKINPVYVEADLQLPKYHYSNLVKEEEIFLNQYRFMIYRMIFSEEFKPKVLLKTLITYIKISLNQVHINSTNIYDTLKLLNIIWGIDFKKYFEINDLKNLNADAIRKFAIQIMSNVNK